LRRGAENVRLEPQPARVLAVLLEHAGDVVTRAELQQQVWGGETFVDFEHGLNYCIAQIRTALGDSASSPRFIETLPRRGYRFVATLNGASAPATDTRRPERVEMRRSWRHPVWIAAAAILVTVAVWALLARRHSVSPERPLRLAVIPFDNET